MKKVELLQIIKRLEEENRSLKAQLKKALERIDELERRLGLNSSNSSKPPSSDGLRKKPTPKSLREKGKRPSGGQKGHKGSSLRQVDNPNIIEKHVVNTCSSCNLSLKSASVNSVIKRQVFDIPQPKVEVTEHRAEVKICTCGKKNTASFPKGVSAPVQYGDSVKALAVYLNQQQLIPEARLKDIFSNLFCLPISKATIAKAVREFAKIVKPLQEQSLEYLKNAAVKHLDETGVRIDGVLMWLHVISNGLMTYYHISKKRKSLIDGVTGIVVHDHWKPYFTMLRVLHALCNAHHLRELRNLYENYGEIWAFDMYQLLCQLNKNKEKVTIESAHHDYDQIIKDGLAYHESLLPLSGRKRRDGHNLAIRLHKFKDETLRFLTNENVPFTNNQAEQDIRMMKVRQKISGCFRTMKGAQDFCIIRGFLSSCRKNKVNLFQGIFKVFARAPSLQKPIMIGAPG